MLLVQRFSEHVSAESAQECIVSPDGRMVAIFGRDSSVRLFLPQLGGGAFLSDFKQEGVLFTSWMALEGPSLLLSVDVKGSLQVVRVARPPSSASEGLQVGEAGRVEPGASPVLLRF